MIRLIILLFLSLVPSAFATINEKILLEAIAEVETGNRDGVIGAAGERGRYQLSRPIQRVVGGYDRAAAQRWMKVVLADMQKYDIPICAYNLAYIWNSGIHAVRKGRIPMSTYDYGARVNNIYQIKLTEAK